MAYFARFPVMEYPVGLDTGDVRFIACRNILRRIVLDENLSQKSAAFLSYTVKDGEKPEHIADRVYGDPSDHWLVLVTNGIIDPYNDWHKSQTVLEEHIRKKYSGYKVYFTNTNNTLCFNSAFNSGATLSQGDVSSSIDYYDPKHCCLSVSSMGFLGGATATIGVSGSSYEVKIWKVFSGPDALHHFQINRSVGDFAGVTSPALDPLGKQTESYGHIGGYIGSVDDPYPPFDSGIGFTGSGTVELWETHIGKYMGISGSADARFSVSNRSYEMTENSNKGSIRVLTPFYKDRAVKDLETLLGG